MGIFRNSRLLRRFFFAGLSVLCMALCPPLGMATSSLHFTGINSYAATPDANTFDFAGSFTIDLSFQSDGPHDGTLVAKFWQNSGSPLDDSYYISVRTDDTLQARIQTTLQLADLRAGGPIHDGEWHHVALVLDTVAHLAELYLDGALGASQSLLGVLRNTVEPVRLGALLNGGGSGSLTSFFSGQMDEIRFWNIARRGEKAWCLKDVTLLTDTPGLVSYYRCDEGTGTLTTDLIPPIEDFSLISGATFSTDEPPLRSRLSGPGQCLCGTIGGTFTAASPAVTVVGDTVRVLASDSLVLNSHTLTIDSTVAQLLIAGVLRTSGTEVDSSRILGQGTVAADATIMLSGTQPTTFLYTRISGFASDLFRVSPPLTIDHCLFADNLGRVITIDNDVTITDARFQNCGGAVNTNGGDLSVSRCEFEGNTDGALSASNANLTVDSTNFSNNSKIGGVGGAINLALNSGMRAELTASTFSGNIVSGGSGGAIFASGDLTLTGSGDSLIIRNCQFLSNTADSGGGLRVQNVNLRIESCLFDSNSAETGGGLWAEATSDGLCRVKGDSVIFTNNQGGGAGAALFAGIAGNAPVEVRVTNSMFAYNLRTQTSEAPALSGSAVRQIAGAGPILERCLFHDNNNSNGRTGAISLENAYGSTGVELRNLTVILNQSDSSAVKLAIPAVLRNSIVIENGSARQITATNSSVAYCLTSDTPYHGAGGSFYADPAFEDFWERDFRLSAGSFAINRGDPNTQYNDADGTRADVGVFAAEPFPAEIESLNDVPHDNGRQLMLQWLPSAGDDSRQGITSYAIYREVNLAILRDFELVATVPAAQLEGYGQIVPTLADSNVSGIPYYSYFVRAQSVNPLAFWDTPLDSGYSVDNLAPSAPQQLEGFEIPGGADLVWEEVADSDLAYYALYRASVPFDPDTATEFFATSLEAAYTDSVVSGVYYYAVRAIDRNGNRSQPSNRIEVSVGILTPPGDLTIVLEGDSLRLNWLPSAGATEYRIFHRFAADEPEDFIGATPDTTYIIGTSDIRGFYYIVAAN